MRGKWIPDAVRVQRTEGYFHGRAMFTMKRTMKTWMALLALGGVLGMQPGAASANPFDGALFTVQDRGGGGGRGHHPGREARQPREARVAQPAPPPQAPRERGRGQLTDEERRQLHRDLDKANRELYRGNQR